MVSNLKAKDSSYGGRVPKIGVTYNFTPSYLFYSSLLKTFFPDRNPQSLWQDQEIYQEICKTSIDETISSNSMTITQENANDIPALSKILAMRTISPGSAPPFIAIELSPVARGLGHNADQKKRR